MLYSETCTFNALNGSLLTFVIFRTLPIATLGNSDKIAFYS
jgi:hypothetical protein